MPEAIRITGNQLTKRRIYVDILSRYLVGLGGISVIIAIVLIFFFLLYVVLPLFEQASIKQVAAYPMPAADAGRSLHLVVEEQTELALRYTEKAKAIFFKTKNGGIVKQLDIKGVKTSVSSFAVSNPNKNLVALGLENGKAVIVQHEFKIKFNGERRHIEANLTYPLGEKAYRLHQDGMPVKQLAIEENEDSLLLASASTDGIIHLIKFSKEESMLEDSATWVTESRSLPAIKSIKKIGFNFDTSRFYILESNNDINLYDLRDFNNPVLLQRLHMLPEDVELSSLIFLSGAVSFLVADQDGTISQWFSTKDSLGNDRLRKIRQFKLKSGFANKITAEYYRKGFVAASTKGDISLYHATSERLLANSQVSKVPLTHLALAPRANALLTQNENNTMRFMHIKNEHPEISWQTLWGKVWYENYNEPDYVWQSSAASNDFEPKFSLVPISFGTIKAAFYAMLFAIPLSLFGAIYTAYFMTPKMRSAVKPSIEIMEALPTVILGFLAGLWLAPFVETYLVGIILLLVLLPPGMLFSAYLVRFFPESIRSRMVEGWEAALLIVPMILIIMFCLFSSQPIEDWLFNGDLPSLMSNKLGIQFDQRNSIIVGIAMGFAVIPTIFTIAEDAIFGVPNHLANGSLALGATPWQTLTRVVLLTASPGIFSAIMMGMGRAVGETMIVLMATGNTPLMDFSIFQGMRTLAANIAVEMPEAELNSSHYRILFLAGLVLFLFTFVVNTFAELVRQRLREKYSKL